MTAWEYHVVTVGIIPPLAWLNPLGEQGWELVAVQGGVAYFKRQKSLLQTRA